MKITYNHYQEYIEKLQLQINLLLAVPLIGFLVLFMKIENNTYHPDILSDLMLMISRNLVILIIAILVFFAFYRFENRIRPYRKPGSLREKLDRFYHQVLIRSLILEAATLISLVGLAVTAEKIYAAYYAVSLAAFSISYPNQSKLIKSLRLNGRDKEIILQREEIPA